MPGPRSTFTRLSILPLGWLLLATPAYPQVGPRKAPAGEAWEQDRYEEKVIREIAGRVAKAADTEGRRWHRELDTAFPGRVGPGLAEEDVRKWFDLLAAGGREWRRDAAPTRQVADLFDRAARQLNLGPVPSIRQDEFLRFAKQSLVTRDPQPRKPGDRPAPSEADRVFRVLDRDGSGLLEPAEWTDGLRAARRADADGNRRIDLAEYRAYFDGRVAEAVEATARPGGAAARPGQSADGPGRLPEWFTRLDTDEDGQVGLYEWRAAGKPIDEFMAMDLDGDGLLTPDEYLRYARQAEASPPAAGAATRSASAANAPRTEKVKK
jgi:hypothetical protein